MSHNDILLNKQGDDPSLPRGEGFNDPHPPRPMRPAPPPAPHPAPHPALQHPEVQQAQQRRQGQPQKPFAHLKAGYVVHDTYELIEPLGQGGMGVVWKAYDRKRFNRIVALKFIKYTQDMARNRASVERFEREAILSARLQHPNLTTLFDFIHLDDGGKVMVLEFVAGETLTQYIKREERLDVLTAVHIALQLSHALGYMHQLNLIHRDLKPDNIMLTPLQNSGGYLFLKLIDLGIAKLLKSEEQAQNTMEEECATPITQTGFVCGTPEYMAPEQLQGKLLSPRSDIYAIGVLLFEMLAGKPPFRCTNWGLFATTRQTTAIPNVRSYSAWSIPESLVTVIHTCLEYNPNKRYANTAELARALEGVLLNAYAQLLPLSSIHLSENGRTYLQGLNTLAQTPAAQAMRAGGGGATGAGVAGAGVAGAGVAGAGVAGAGVAGAGASLNAARGQGAARVPLVSSPVPDLTFAQKDINTDEEVEPPPQLDAARQDPARPAPARPAPARLDPARTAPPARSPSAPSSAPSSAARLNLSDLWQGALKERHQSLREWGAKISDDLRGLLSEYQRKDAVSPQIKSLGLFFFSLVTLLVMSTVNVQRKPRLLAPQVHQELQGAQQPPASAFPSGQVVRSSIVPPPFEAPAPAAPSISAPLRSAPILPSPAATLPSAAREAAPEAVAREAAPEAVAPEAVAPEAVAPEAVAPEAVAPEPASASPKTFDALQISINPLAPLAPLKELIGRKRSLESRLAERDLPQLRAQLALISALYDQITPLMRRRPIERGRVYQVLSEARFASLGAYGWMDKLKMCYSPSRPPCSL
jgi:serine/threonine protein kinase